MAETLFDALKTIGRKEELRNKVIDLCRDIEKTIKIPDRSVRDEITDPILSALHADVGTMRKALKSGTVFEFKYRSKIARDFVMSSEPTPDHVWEPQTTKLGLYLARDARQVVIGGAYFGEHAVLIAEKLVHTDGICHAFEPNEEQFIMLQNNGRNNGLRNIVYNKAGLWENDNTTLTLVGDDSHAHPEVAGEQHPLSERDAFPTISLNTYGTQHNIDRIDMIMLDIEGGELHVLRGANNYLSQPPDIAPKIIFEVHRNYVDWSDGLQNTEIIRFLTGFRYHVFSIRDFQSNYPMGGLPVELIPPERTYLKGPPHGFNMLAVKDVGVIKDDFFKICYDVSPKLLLHKDPKLHHPINGLRGE